MKQLAVILMLMAVRTIAGAQPNEFNTASNGLIYPDTTIQQLKFIVDSLNLKFKVCDLAKVYQSSLQAKANYITLDTGNVAEAKKDMENELPFDDFIKKYKHAVKENNLLVVRSIYKNYQNKEQIGFNSIALDNKNGHALDYPKNLIDPNKPLKGKWLFKYYGRTDYSKESILAYYFIEDFHEQPLAEKYAKLVQYADCLIDTTTQVFTAKAKKSGNRFMDTMPTQLKAFMHYIGKATLKPEYDEYAKYARLNNPDRYYTDYLRWFNSLRLHRTDSLRKTDPQFNVLLKAAITDALANGGSTDEFEQYVGLYASKKEELALKRNRIVIGGCSMDDAPRVHALNIAQLSAETINWDIFLRSHLDIMNDRFERVSDGSYAWKGRKTYIKELEVLDINILDLLLGISLRIENPSGNHYFGSIGRLGRALAESVKSTEIAARMLRMIADPELDDYNRVLMYYLFLNYNYNLDNKERQSANKERLALAVQTLPAYLSSQMVAVK